MKILMLLTLCFLSSHIRAQVCNISGRLPGVADIVVSYRGHSFLDIIKDTVSADADGFFSYNVPVAAGPRECYLKFPDNELILWAIEGVDIIIERSKNGQISFSGESKEIQYYLLTNDDHWSKIYNNFQRNDLMQELSTPHTDGYFKIQDQITAARIDYLNNCISIQDYDSQNERYFVGLETQNLIFLNLYYKLNFNNPQLDKFKFFSDAASPPSGEYYGYTQDNPFNNRELLKSIRFLEFANVFFIQVAVRSLKKQDELRTREQYLNEVFTAIDSIVRDDYCRQIHKVFFLADELKDMTLFEGHNGLTPELFKTYLAITEGYHGESKETAALKRLIETRYNDLTKSTNVAIDEVALLDQSGKPFEMTSLRGKLIYIDVWASWCRPCIESLPDWNLLVKKWKGNESITFLMVSIDSNIDQWKNAINRHRPSALQLISPGDFQKSDFAKKLNIEMLPAYVVINKDGKVISTRAPRPKEFQLADFLQKSLR